MATVATAVIRNLKDLVNVHLIERSDLVADEAIPSTSNGLDDGRPLRRVELFPEVIDVHLDDVRIALEPVAPDDVDEFSLRDDVPGIGHETGQDLDLPPRELNFCATTRAPAPHEVELHRAARQRPCFAHLPAA